MDPYQPFYISANLPTYSLKGSFILLQTYLASTYLSRDASLSKVGVFSTCDATDKWNWTVQGSLQYKKQMCLTPKTGGIDPDDNIVLVLGSVCNESKNFFRFAPSKYHIIALCT